MPETTYIIGHRNPDADAICSAIAYTAFKKASKAPGHYTAARCGNSNARIDAILRRFKLPLPFFLSDATPRVRDIMRTRIYKVQHDATCGDALEQIDTHDVRALPVVDHDNRLQGMVSVFSLGEFFIPKVTAPRKMRRVHTNIDHIVRSLKARVANIEDPDRVQDLYIRVGAMDIRSFGKSNEVDGINASESIIIVGDRYDIQQKALMAGVRLLVVTGDLEIDNDVLEIAKERKTSVLVSPWDTATTSWLIRTATVISPMIDTEVSTYSPEDKLVTARRKASGSYAPLYCVVDDRQRLHGVFSKTDLIKPTNKKLILVDHNELSQAVPGASECDIVEIIDHHRLGNPPTAQPITFRNDIIGSTSSIIACMYRESGITPEPKIAGIMMSGLISDTLNLQGPTTTERDRQLLPWLANIAGESVEAVANLIFQSGSIILSSEPLDVIKADCKHYQQGDLPYSASQVEELGFDNFYQHREALVEALEVYRASEGLSFSALLVTDVNKQNSLLLVRGDEEIVDNINYARTEMPFIFDLPGIVSRKKQLIPYFTTMLEHFDAA